MCLAVLSTVHSYVFISTPKGPFTCSLILDSAIRELGESFPPSEILISHDWLDIILSYDFFFFFLYSMASHPQPLDLSFIFKIFTATWNSLVSSFLFSLHPLSHGRGLIPSYRTYWSAIPTSVLSLESPTSIHSLSCMYSPVCWSPWICFSRHPKCKPQAELFFTATLFCSYTPFINDGVSSHSQM